MSCSMFDCSCVDCSLARARRHAQRYRQGMDARVRTLEDVVYAQAAEIRTLRDEIARVRPWWRR